jgi:hypothetical protein
MTAFYGDHCVLTIKINPPACKSSGAKKRTKLRDNILNYRYKSGSFLWPARGTLESFLVYVYV